MHETTHRATWSDVTIGSALLTTGSGPIVNSVCRAMVRYTDLRGVILSKNREAPRRWKKFRKYGVWYALQYVTSRLLNVVTANGNIRTILPEAVIVRTWEERQDQQSIMEWLLRLRADFAVVCGLHHILSKRFFSRFKYCINVHPSLLPVYRGPEPIIWGLLDKSPVFGITLHLVDEGIDTGDIICQRAADRPTLPLSFIVQMRLANMVPDLIKCAVEQMQAGELHPRRQEGGFYLPTATLANRRLRDQRRGSKSQRVSPYQNFSTFHLGSFMGSQLQ